MLKQGQCQSRTGAIFQAETRPAQKTRHSAFAGKSKAAMEQWSYQMNMAVA